MQIELDPVVFRDWLASQPEGAVVGLSCEPVQCPLASFLQAAYGGSWLVGPDDVSRYDEQGCFRGAVIAPGWVSVFLVRVDASVGGGDPISREIALAALNGVLQEVQ